MVICLEFTYKVDLFTFEIKNITKNNYIVEFS